MKTFQEWVEPILWIISTLVAFGGFARLYAPLWKFLQSPKELSKCIQRIEVKMDSKNAKSMDSIEKIDKKMDNRIACLTSQFDRLETKLDGLAKQIDQSRKVDIVILRRDIKTLCERALETRTMSIETYETIMSMYDEYKALGGNHFVDALVNQIQKLYYEVTGYNAQEDPETKKGK